MKEQDERPFWKLDRSEQRVLVITFVGGLASIIAGACILGIAVALARNEERGHGFKLVGLLVYTATLGTLTILSPVSLRMSSSRLVRQLSRVAFIGSALLLTVIVLVWVGIAAGIH